MQKRNLTYEGLTSDLEDLIVFFDSFDDLDECITVGKLYRRRKEMKNPRLRLSYKCKEAESYFINI